jgi:hypothetical protein
MTRKAHGAKRLCCGAWGVVKHAEHEGVHIDDMDIAWGFYCAMHTRHPELMQAYTSRMREMMQAVRDIEKATKFTGNGYWTQEEIDEDRANQINAALRGCGGITKEK